MACKHKLFALVRLQLTGQQSLGFSSEPRKHELFLQAERMVGASTALSKLCALKVYHGFANDYQIKSETIFVMQPSTLHKSN